MADAPGLSVILVAAGPVAGIETTLLHLRRQAAANRIELLIVTPSKDRLGSPPVDLSPLHSVRVVEDPSAAGIASGNAAGVRAARAPVVAFAEDHAFPDATWAEALLRAHDGTVAAVGPAFVNANPATAASWVDFLMGYVHWMEPCPGGETRFLPGHNSSYRRDVLLARGNTLESDLEVETVLHLELSGRGERLVVAPEARIAHVNFSLWGPKLIASFHHGRVFAAARAEHWRRARRVAFTAASPAIPLVRLARILRLLVPPGRRGLVPWTAVPGLFVGLAADAIGQALGYAAGAGASSSRLARYETGRARYLTDGDRERLARLTASLRDA